MGKFKDLTGQRFGNLTVIEMVEDYITSGGNALVQWKCTCDCGTTDVMATSTALINGNKKSCGCLNHEHKSYREIENLIGCKFGRLTVVGKGEHITKDGKHRLRWICNCDCGTTGIYVIPSHLKDGHTKSCGCITKENNRKRCRKYNKYDLKDSYGICYLVNGEEVLFDLGDYELIKDYYWKKDKYGYVVSQQQNNSIIEVVRMHRLIMGLSKDDNRIIDHIKHNQLDNRKAFLRVVDYSQNGQNQKLSSANTSGYTGVSWIKKSNKWKSYIKINSKQINLGLYDDIEDAVIARKNAEEKYFGEYSYKNSMNKGDNLNG